MNRFKSVTTISTFSLIAVLLFASSVDAQLFRRFARQRSQAQARQYSQQNQNQVQSANRVSKTPQGTYYRRVQVAPGRYALVPVQPGKPKQQTASAPEDIAKAKAREQAGSDGRVPVSVSLEGPESGSPAIARSKDTSTQSSQQTVQPQTLYRRVTVYNPRTGQRSVRMVPVPSSSLAQQSYQYGQNRVEQTTSKPQVVNGALYPYAPVPKGTSIESPVRLDSQVKQTTFDDSSITLDSPSSVASIPAVVLDAQPALATSVSDASVFPNNVVEDSDRQFSVLEFGDDESSESRAKSVVELAPPTN